MPQDILVVGSLNMDQVIGIPRLPIMGETLTGAGDLRLVPGGKGANQAVAMARLGGSVAMAGRVGNDPFGIQLRQGLLDDGINVELVVSDGQSASGVALIFLSPQGENAIILSPGANGRVGQDAEQQRQILAALDHVRMLVLQLEIPLEVVQFYIREAHARGVQVVLNLAPAQPLPLEILRQLSLLILNESEISLLTGQNVDSVEEAHKAASALLQQGIQTVVVTLGARGALLVTTVQGQERFYYQEALKVQVVDTTAAGDCFVGALVVALIEGQEPQEALRFAVTASALKVTRFGAQPGLPHRDEVLAFSSQHR
ncbi:MAG TPA: ribokinase [Ktedonobacteraceae bacterium]|nr:ribokinase [Ktedonobacteraceae bacterium]